MAKDPRFNFYPDNWMGGTEGFTLEQEGAYLALIILQSKVGRFTPGQAMDKLMQKTRGNTAVCTGLWNFLIPKFETDGKVYWSDRLEKEIAKSRNHSEKQAERIKKRWSKNSGNTTVYTSAQVLPVNGSGNGIGSDTEREEGPGEGSRLPSLQAELDAAFNDLYLEPLLMNGKRLYPGIDIALEAERFRQKVLGSPRVYKDHDVEGLRLAFGVQLRNATPSTNGNDPIKRTPANAIVEPSATGFGKL